jgi:hypothetical protein
MGAADIRATSVASLIAPSTGAAASGLAASSAAVPVVPQPAAPADPLGAALAAALTDAAARQDGLAPLLANLAVAAGASDLPPAIHAAIADLLAAQTPLDSQASGAALRAAAQDSGLFLEATLAAQALGGKTADPARDLKSLLSRLIEALRAEGEGETPPLSASRTPPPLAGAPTAGQPAARPTIDPQTPPDVTVRALRQQAEAALARVELSQAASAPKAGEPPRWMFETPVATPGGTGVAQFAISRDGGGGGGEGAAPSWRARFSVDAAPGGPVHAAVILSGGRLRVTLLAEDDGSRAALAAGQDELQRLLAAEGDEVAVRVLGGAPAPAMPPPGQFVDRRS